MKLRPKVQIAITPGNPDTPLSVGDASKELGVSRSQVSYAMNNGYLPFKRAGGWRWVTRGDLYAWARRRS